MDVTDDNFAQQLPQILNTVQNASFVGKFIVIHPAQIFRCVSDRRFKLKTCVTDR